MKKRTLLHRFIVSFLLFLAQKTLFAADIEWNYNNKASANGSGCSSQDTAFIAAGNEVSVIFSNLGINLTGLSDGRRVMRKGCDIDIPAKISQGRYVGRLDETLTWGYVQHGESEGRIQVVTWFIGSGGKFDHSISKHTSSRNEPFLQTRKSRNLPNTHFCHGRPTHTSYRASFDLFAKRDRTQDEIVLQIDGLDIRFEVSGIIQTCPNHRGRP